MSSPSLSEFESLYRSSFRRFVRVAVAITRDEDTASEAVQEAFARAIRGRSGFKGDGPLDAWLWRAVVNEAKRLSMRPRTVSTEVAAEAHSERSAAVGRRCSSLDRFAARASAARRFSPLLRRS